MDTGEALNNSLNRGAKWARNRGWGGLGQPKLSPHPLGAAVIPVAFAHAGHEPGQRSLKACSDFALQPETLRVQIQGGSFMGEPVTRTDACARLRSIRAVSLGEVHDQVQEIQVG